MQNFSDPPATSQNNAESTPVHDEFDRSFRPTGAIAFFIALIITGLIIWFGIYFLMLERL